MMKSTKKFSERWIKVATIGREKELISLNDKGSTGSVRSTMTMRTVLDGGRKTCMGGACHVGSSVGLTSPGGGSSCVSDLAKLPLEDFIDTVRENSVCLHQTDHKGANVLHHAALKGREDIIKYILDCGGDSKAQDSEGNTPLHWAVRGNNPQAVNELMRSGANPAVLNDYKMAPLHLACDLDMPDMVEAICCHGGIDVNIPGEYGQTPLHYSAIKNAFEASKKLMCYKPKYCQRDDNGVYVIHCAATHASRDVLNMLLEKAEENGYPREYVLRQNDKEKNSALHSAVNSGSEEAVRVCIEFGSPLDVLQEDKSTPLHLAASQGSLPMVKLLLSPPDSERTLTMCDVEDMTPLHRAAMFDHVDVVEFLVGQGADMDAVDKNGYSPLLRAVSRGSFRSATLLNKHGADCNLRDCRNRNILHLAVLSGKTIKAYGMDTLKSNIQVLLNDVDVSGCTPIHYATRDGNIKSLQNLIELGATVNLKNFEKQSPLHFAARYGRFNSCKRLLDSSIGPNIINDIDGEGMTALHIAALNGHTKVIQLLVIRGALLHRDYKGRTPLHLAAMGDFLDCMKLLLTTHGYLLDQADDNGDTALLLAAATDMSKSVDFLLTNDASLAVNNDKKGLMATAVSAHNVDVAHTIVAHKRWQEVLHIYLVEQPDSLRNLISRVPEVYKKILDRSVTRSLDPPNSTDFWVKYDFGYLQPPIEERIEKERKGLPISPLPSMNLMLENKQIDLLPHPVCVEYLNMKWKSYGASIHMISMSLHVIFVACLMGFIIKNGEYYTLSFRNGTGSICTEATTLPSQNKHQLSEGVVGLAYVMCIYSVINIIKECSQIWYQLGKYFTDCINFLEWGLYVCTLVFTVPFLFHMSCDDHPELCSAQWQCGAVAAFLSWLLMLLYQQRIDVIGIYVVMFEVILKTLLRVLVVFFVLILAFTMPLYMLMKDETNKAFSTVPLAIFRVFTMMMAEIDFINSFVGPATDDDDKTMPFEHLSFVFLGLFIIMLPIILMNLLIGLAVGDIAKVQQDAKLKRLAMQVELYTEMEQKIPTKIMEWVDMDYVLIFPNKKMCQREQYGSKLLRKFKKTFRGKKDKAAKTKAAMKSIEQFKGMEDGEQTNSEIGSLKKKMKSLSTQMDKQYDLLRLIVQKMDISSEADDQDEGKAPPSDSCGKGRLRVDLPQIVRAAAMMRGGAKERMKFYQPAERKPNNNPPEPSV